MNDAGLDSLDELPVTRAGAVAKRIRSMIISGELAPGERLRQNDLATRLGVSSTPVREAFLELSRQGLVRQDTHRGAVVFEPTIANIEEDYELRMALEPLASELAAKLITPAELDRLDELIGQMRVAMRTDLDRQTQVLNRQFHAKIYSASGRPKLIEMIDTLRSTAVVYHALLLQPHAPPDYLDAVDAEHTEIVAALRARAPKRAARATRAHLEHSLAQTMLHFENGQ